MEAFLKKNESPVIVLIVFLSLLFVLMILSAPLFASLGFRKVSFFNYLFFSPVCHQIQERSFSLWGYPCAVCARCMGIYLGFLTGAVLFMILPGRDSRRETPEGWILYFSALPAVLDLILNFSGAYSSPVLLRSATGFLPGSLLPLYLIPGICEIALSVHREQSMLSWRKRWKNLTC